METVKSILKRKGSEVWSIRPDQTVYQALKLMAEKGVGALLVIDEGKLAGIISERDYARKVILKDKLSKETAVREIMCEDLITVTAQNTLEDCMRIMTRERVRHLPVVEGSELKGMISIGDVVNAIISTQAHTIDQLNNYVRGAYPA